MARARARTWADFEAASQGEEKGGASPAPDEATLEELRSVQSIAVAAAAAREEERASQNRAPSAPYVSRLYQKGCDDGDILQLQWIRLDLTHLDVEESESRNDEATLLKPAVCLLDPRPLLPYQYVEVPSSLRESTVPTRLVSSSSNDTDELRFGQLESQGMVETQGIAEVSARISSSIHSEGPFQKPLVFDARNLTVHQWSICFEESTSLSSLDPPLLGRLLSEISTSALADCIFLRLPIVLKGLPAVDGVADLCGKIVATGRLSKLSPSQFSNEVLSLDLGELGLAGKEAEVALAESYTYDKTG